MQKQAQDNNFAEEYAKEIFLQESQPLVLSEPSDILHPTVSCAF